MFDFKEKINHQLFFILNFRIQTQICAELLFFLKESGPKLPSFFILSSIICVLLCFSDAIFIHEDVFIYRPSIAFFKSRFCFVRCWFTLLLPNKEGLEFFHFFIFKCRLFWRKRERLIIFSSVFLYKFIFKKEKNKKKERKKGAWRFGDDLCTSFFRAFFFFCFL